MRDRCSCLRNRRSHHCLRTSRIHRHGYLPHVTQTQCSELCESAEIFFRFNKIR